VQSVLPPLPVSTARLVISGVLQPSYDICGDTFDYAIDGDVAHVAVFDAMDHGLDACRLASIGDEPVGEQSDPERFLTGVLTELDLRNGRLRWVNAGHPAPLLLRSQQVVSELHTSAVLPLGFAGQPSWSSGEAGPRALHIGLSCPHRV
jgi:serine phosphatase RsbU (regulator of sigma subunit)